MIHTKQRRGLSALKKQHPISTLDNGWRSIPHFALVQTLIETGKRRGWDTQYLSSWLSTDKDQMVASLQLQEQINHQCFPSGVVLNSNAQDFRPHLYGGTTLLPDGIGLPLTKIWYSKKTSRFDLKAESELVLDEYANRMKSFGYMIRALKETHLTRERIDRILLKAGRADLLPDSRVMRLLKEFQGNTAWELLLAFARMAQMSPPLVQMNQVHSFLYDYLHT